MTLADRIAVLSAGHKMQYGSPHQIYNSPAALFVAAFTGSPPRNLVPCALAHGMADLGGGVRVALPRTLALNAASLTKGTFGIRPENILLTPPNASQAQSTEVPASVVLTEPLGAETLVTFKTGDVELVARCPASFTHAVGSSMPIYIDSQHMHLFDPTHQGALS
jgi:multiple sugar transport system ATP-binding protein